MAKLIYTLPKTYHLVHSYSVSNGFSGYISEIVLWITQKNLLVFNPYFVDHNGYWNSSEKY